MQFFGLVQLLVVIESLQSVIRILKTDEPKSFRSRIFITHDANVLELTKRLEFFSELILSPFRVWEIFNIEVIGHLRSASPVPVYS